MITQAELYATYEIYNLIGSGGGGRVYRALHKRLEKEVVLKEITLTGISMEQCQNEMRILKNLRHSYLPQVIDFMETENGIYTVMDYIPGKSLQAMLDEGYTFREKEVLKYARQLCEVLAYLHAQKSPIIHGDIKPDNIMITPEGNVCLIDFNISGILNGQGIATIGYTPYYASPEQVQAYEIRKARSKQSRKGQPPKKESQKTRSPFPETQILPKTQLLQETQSTEETSKTRENQSIQETILLGKEEEKETKFLLGKIAAEKETEYLPEKAAIEKTAKQKLPVIDCRSDIYSVGATLYILLTGKLLEADSSSVSDLLRKSNLSEMFQIILRKALDINPAKRYQNAGQLHRILLQIDKKKRRYRQLVWKQEAAVIGLALFFSLSFLTVLEGRKLLQAEKQEQYGILMEQLEEGRTAGTKITAEQWEQCYAEAITLYPSYLDVYYEKANYLFGTGQYEETISYIEQTLSLSLEGTEALWGNFYYLYAESFFRLEEYEKACLYYQMALSYINNPYIYRDYAISLAYLDRTEEARRMLKEATENGMEQADVFMVQGELARIAGKWEEAISCLEQVLQETEDEYLRQRAYLVASETFAGIGTEEALQQDVTWLLAGIEELSLGNRLLLYERLEQDYIQLGDRLEEKQYYVCAVRVLEEIRKMRWDTYRTYSNAIVLCQKMEDLKEAEIWAADMLKKYPEQYITYLRLAYLEVEKQGRKPAKKRDYKTFWEYYGKSKQLYEEQMTGNKTDAEMQRLESIYTEVEEGGWLE